MFCIVMSILCVLVFSTFNIFGMEITFPMPTTIIYNNDVSKEDQPVLSPDEKSFLHNKMLLWKKVAQEWHEVSPDPISQLIKHIPSIDILLGDSDVLHYKNIVEQTYSFSAHRVKHLNSFSLILPETKFREKLLYLEMLLYYNTAISRCEDKIGMTHRLNNPSTDNDAERNCIIDFFFRHQNCGIDKAKILAAIFLLYLP